MHWALSVNRLIPFFYHVIGAQSLRELDVPEAFVDLWDANSRAVLRSNRRATRASLEISNFLAKADIPCVVMRGASILYRAYGDERLRPMFDVDMAIPKDRADDLVSLFSDTSPYAFTKSNHQIVCEVGRVMIEIHWHIIKRKFADSLDFGRLLQEPEELVTEWGELRVPTQEHELIGVIAHHFLHHDMDRLLKVLDVAMLCDRFSVDWDYIRDWAERAGLLEVFQFTLSLVDRLLDTDFHARLGAPDLRHFDERTFEPYLTKLFGRDTRRAWARRLATSIALVDGAGFRVQMLRRHTRNQNFKDILTVPYDARKAARLRTARTPSAGSQA